MQSHLFVLERVQPDGDLECPYNRDVCQYYNIASEARISLEIKPDDSKYV